MAAAEIFPWQRMLWQQMKQPKSSQHHALLLKGRRGIGKLAFARALAKSMLCAQNQNAGMACEKCSDCHWFEQGTHPNIYCLEPEALSELKHVASESTGVGKTETTSVKTAKKLSQQITIAQIRALDDFIYLSAHQERDKIILIHPTEAMNVAAANALLKKLEEPPPGVLFLLVTHNTASIPATVLSRCQQIMMPVPTRQQAREWLQQQGIRQPDFCLAMAGFSPLLALQHDEQQAALHAAFIQSLSTPEKFDLIAWAEKLHKQDLSTVTGWVQKWCYDLMSCRAGGRIYYHLQQADKIRQQAATVDLIALGFLWRELAASQQLASHPLNARLFLEELFLNLLEIVYQHKPETG